MRLAFALPTGQQGKVGDENSPFPPSILSIGRGTYAVDTRADLTLFVARRLALIASVGGAVPLASNAGGITFAPSLDYALGGLWLPIEALNVLGRVAARYQPTSRSLLEGELLNSGGHWLAAELGLGWRVDARWSVGLIARIPFFVHAFGTQLVETISGLATVSVSFGGASAKKKGSAVEASRPAVAVTPKTVVRADLRDDVRDLARGGRSFRLEEALAGGRVTVVLFWADWCRPCHEIEARLRRLARHHPISVRRAEVPRFDTPVGREHLPGQSTLPVVWLFGRDGRSVAKLHALAAGPETVEATVLRLLR